MLESIRIRNFQSIKKADLQPGKFSIIIGESDLGKSAIVRAIRALVYNQSGQSFITHGESKAGVGLKFDDVEVGWIKGESSTYKMGDLVFDKTGRSLPSEVAEELRMGEIVVGNLSFDVNIHNQLDRPFLVMETAPARAKILGELSGTNLIYLAIQSLRKDEQQDKKLRTTRIGDLEKAQEELESFKGLVDRQTMLVKIKRKIDNLKKLDERCQLIEQWRSSLLAHQDNLKISEIRSEKASQILDKVNSLIEKYQRVATLESTLGKLYAIIARVADLEKDAVLTLEEFRSIEEELSSLDQCPTCRQPISHGVLTS